MQSSTLRESSPPQPFTFSSVLTSPTIYETYIGLDRNLALILGGVNTTVYALSAFGSYPMIERLGRRKMFLWGTAGQALAMVCFHRSSIQYSAD